MHAGQLVKLKWSLAKPKGLINLAKEYANGFEKGNLEKV
jgi:hypothetical protein